MSGFHFFPRSLRQLVLFAFLLVILPLLFLAIQAYQSLNHLSDEAVHTNQTTLEDAQRVENMSSLALDMERRYRQYCVLKEQSLETLYNDLHKQYTVLLNEHKLSVQIKNVDLYPELTNVVIYLEKLHCEEDQPTPAVLKSLQQFSSINGLISQATQDVLLSRSKQLQESIVQQGTFFSQRALIVFVLSLILVIAATYMIIKPVKVINGMITRLGEGDFINNTPAVNGPLELKELAQRIIWLSDRLAWLEAQRHQFLRHLSHELKTPLASMREGTELLADEVVGELTAEQKDVVTILDDSSKHLQELIEQLLDYNRKLADLPDEKHDIDLNELMTDVMTKNSLPAKAKSMTTECQLSVSHYWGEETLLARIIDNLYSNAIHYGAESGKIWLSSQKAGDFLYIDIANTGDKIAEKDRAMLFEPFYQGSRQRKGAVKGSGLGLSIARDCVYRMKGELQIIDVDYADVCFRITLPLTTKLTLTTEN